jgi:hypothetical protein
MRPGASCALDGETRRSRRSTPVMTLLTYVRRFIVTIAALAVSRHASVASR